MTIETSIFNNIFTVGSLFLVKSGFIALAILYFIFSLIVVRQVKMMTDTLMTEGAPLLIGLSIIHAGLALGVIILFVGIL